MFAKLSKDKAQSQRILLDSLFVTDYLPYAPDVGVKVFLYGLTLASGAGDNSIENISRALGITEDEVLSAFKYWEDQGLVTIISISPPQIEFKEIRPASEQIRHFRKAKYAAFNEQLHAMTTGRTILPGEYGEYYNAMESLHIEQEAMLTIIAYCMRLKGENIGYPYIMTVARSLAAEGVITYERVNERLSELDLYGDEIKAVLKALGLKRSADVSDKRLWLKWTKSLGFEPPVIIKVAKEIKKGGMDKLDSQLTRYYENRVMSYEEIKAYNQNRDKLYSLTANILKILGKYYDRLDYIIESYTQRWLALGFEDEALVAIADHCFKRSKRGLEDMDAAVEDFYRQGLLTISSIDGFRAKTQAIDERIKKLLNIVGIDRSVSTWDRDSYHTWTYLWKMPDDVIEYAASLAQGKPLSYVGGILANFNARGVHDVESAKRAGVAATKPAADSPTVVTKKSVEELNSLFGDVAPEDI